MSFFGGGYCLSFFSAILTTLHLLIHEHGMFSHLFKSLIFLTMFCSFWNICSALLWRTLFLFYSFSDAVVNRTVFLISFLDCLLLVYGNTADFCVCWSYTLPLCWIHSLALSLFLDGFSLYRVMSSLSRDSFTSSFHFFLPNCSDESFQSTVEKQRWNQASLPCLDLRRKAFSISLMNIFHRCHLLWKIIIKMSCFYSNFSKFFCPEMVLDFVKVLFLYQLRW